MGWQRNGVSSRVQQQNRNLGKMMCIISPKLPYHSIGISGADKHACIIKVDWCVCLEKKRKELEIVERNRTAGSNHRILLE